MQEIIKILNKEGPLTGKELQQKSRYDEFSLWRICNKSDEIINKSIGYKYLRLDKRVEGYARLSPSILREFLTYTIVGLKNDTSEIQSKSKALYSSIKGISKDKFELSKDIISKIVNKHASYKEIKEKAVFIIAGDIVYNMAHNEMRLESSTNKMVRGSDLDIIIITEKLNKDYIDHLDQALYNQKYLLLKMPAYREEIDYIIKDIDKVKEQTDFNNFEYMVACKNLDEGKFLYGNMQLFKKIKDILKQEKIPEKLEELKNFAFIEREKAKSHLLGYTEALGCEQHKQLFYTTEETEEIF